MNISYIHHDLLKKKISDSYTYEGIYGKIFSDHIKKYLNVKRISFKANDACIHDMFKFLAELY